MLSDFIYVKHCVKTLKSPRSYIYEYMRDNKCIIHQISKVVDDGYKINVFANAWFKVFSQHLSYIFRLKSFNLGKN